MIKSVALLSSVLCFASASIAEASLRDLTVAPPSTVANLPAGTKSERVRNFLFKYFYNQSNKKTWEHTLSNLKVLYGATGDFNYYLNGEPKGTHFTSVDAWAAAVPADVKDAYSTGQYIMTNLEIAPDAQSVVYWAYQMSHGVLVSQDIVYATIAEAPDGTLTLAHADIYFNTLNVDALSKK